MSTDGRGDASSDASMGHGAFRLARASPLQAALLIVSGATRWLSAIYDHTTCRRDGLDSRWMGWAQSSHIWPRSSGRCSQFVPIFWVREVMAPRSRLPESNTAFRAHQPTLSRAHSLATAALPLGNLPERSSDVGRPRDKGATVPLIDASVLDRR
jgi:hypothetical protein